MHLVTHGGLERAYKQFKYSKRQGETELERVTEEATLEYTILCQAYGSGTPVVSPSGENHRNVIKPYQLVKQSSGGHVVGFLMDPLEGENLTALTILCA